MMTSSLSHHVTIDSRFINLFMSVIILEGVGRQLYKNLDIVGTALPVIMYSVPEYGEVRMMKLLYRRLHVGYSRKQICKKVVVCVTLFLH